MHAYIRGVLSEPGEHLPQTVATDRAGALLHLPVGADAQHVLGAVPELLEVVAKPDGTALRRAPLLGVVADLEEKLAPLLIAQVGDAALGVVRLLLIHPIRALAREQLTELQLEGVDRGVVLG